MASWTIRQPSGVTWSWTRFASSVWYEARIPLRIESALKVHTALFAGIVSLYEYGGLLVVEKTNGGSAGSPVETKVVKMFGR
jgi:hypothetical protein